jgi:hypothetical protein
LLWLETNHDDHSSVQRDTTVARYNKTQLTHRRWSVCVALSA